MVQKTPSQVTKDSKVLDLGSGHGGGTHAMVQKFGCTVDVRSPPLLLRLFLCPLMGLRFCSPECSGPSATLRSYRILDLRPGTDGFASVSVRAG